MLTAFLSRAENAQAAAVRLPKYSWRIVQSSDNGWRLEPSKFDCKAPKYMSFRHVPKIVTVAKVLIWSYCERVYRESGFLGPASLPRAK